MIPWCRFQLQRQRVWQINRLVNDRYVSSSSSTSSCCTGSGSILVYALTTATTWIPTTQRYQQQYQQQQSSSSSLHASFRIHKQKSSRNHLARLFASSSNNNNHPSHHHHNPSRRKSWEKKDVFESLVEEQNDISGYTRPVIMWYPGHIAKAERQLSETIKAVDVVIEVRDARIPRATTHPKISTWCAGRPRIVVLTHSDLVTEHSIRSWRRSYKKYGAQHPEAIIDEQIRNQAAQAFQERLKYKDINNSDNIKKYKRNDKRDFHNGSHGAKPENHMVAPVEDVIYVNAKSGWGVFSLTNSIIQAGQYVHERRAKRGMQGRPLRVGILGYPNVGKSALINRLLGRRRAKTANTPGVTRSLQWIKVRNQSDTSVKSEFARKKEFELLDSPGIIPASMVDQSEAMLLAACNCIGEAAFDNQSVAAYLCEWILQLHRLGFARENVPQWRQKCLERYKYDPPVEDKNYTGDDMLYDVADNTCQGDPEDASRKIIQDFRKGHMGPCCLQVAPVESSNHNPMGLSAEENRNREMAQTMRNEWEQQIQARAALAKVTAKERGLELPPMVEKREQNSNELPSDEDTKAVGKGMFDGW